MTSDQVEGISLAEGEQPNRVLEELGRLGAQMQDIRQHIVALDAVEEQHRIELDAARAEAADAQAALREWQAKAEEWRRQLKETRQRLQAAEARYRRAEEDRSAVIAALGRKGRRLVSRPTDE